MQQSATSESFTSDVVTGVAAIENERREVSRRVGVLLAAADEKTVSRLNARLLVFARRTVVEHFNAEEELMWETGYPNVFKHKEEHARLAAYVESLDQELTENGPDPDLEVVATRLLANWILNHVNTHDRDFEDFLEELCRD